MVSGSPTSSVKKACVGILHTLRHTEAHPLSSSTRHRSTSTPCLRDQKGSGGGQKGVGRRPGGDLPVKSRRPKASAPH
eukprot:8517654-Pyramimonas_sp.AAC.1